MSDWKVKALRPFKNCFNYIDVSHSRQPLVKGERLVRCERKTATTCLTHLCLQMRNVYTLWVFFGAGIAEGRCGWAIARKQKVKADSTLRTSQAVPHPSTIRALSRLTSEVRRDPVYSTRYGRQRRPLLGGRPRLVLSARARALLRFRVFFARFFWLRSSPLIFHDLPAARTAVRADGGKSEGRGAASWSSIGLRVNRLG